jgi:hypothetical protein
VVNQLASVQASDQPSCYLAISHSAAIQSFTIPQSANQPISQSANQPISQSANQPISQSANQPISQSANQHLLTASYFTPASGYLKLI